jgi:two-component system, LuxR family, response regulator FixJ
MQSDAIVHVIDDDEAVRDSLTFLLKAAGLKVLTHDSATSFLGALSQIVLSQIRSGCVVTDVRMPDISGVDLLRRLGALHVKLPVVVITGHGDVPLAVEAMKAGALDFLEKPFDDEALLAVVRAALQHHGADAKREADRAEIIDRLATLSNRERQVLDGLVAGHPNKTIAYDHGISPRTVEIYRANLMSKMEATSLSDLVRMALVGGMLDGGGTTEPPKSAR